MLSTDLGRPFPPSWAGSRDSFWLTPQSAPGSFYSQHSGNHNQWITLLPNRKSVSSYSITPSPQEQQPPTERLFGQLLAEGQREPVHSSLPVYWKLHWPGAGSVQSSEAAMWLAAGLTGSDRHCVPGPVQSSNGTCGTQLP